VFEDIAFCAASEFFVILGRDARRRLDQRIVREHRRKEREQIL
jgi:hypothetical protein